MLINGANDSLVRLDRRTVELSTAAVQSVSAADLRRGTPCAGWSLGDLLGHMIAQHNGFAAAAGGERSDVAAWAVRPMGDEPAAEYTAAADRVIAAFAAHLPDRGFWLPEISAGGPIPAAMAISMHLVDYVVHAWDVAATVGADLEFDDDLTSAALAVAEQVPDDESREAEGAAFKPALPVPPGSSTLDRLLLLLGRDPRWSAV
jgi:uncharacterized protein (TIGR03086 family)